MSYTQTPNYGLYKPTIDADNDQWGTHLNSNSDTLDATLRTIANTAGVVSFNTRGGVVTLTSPDVIAVLPPSTTAPSMDGAATAGTGTTWARADHVHPTDTGIAAALHNIGRNLIHNPLFNVAQRGAGPFAGNVYTLDRWISGNASSLDTVAFAQVALGDTDRAQIGDEAATHSLNNGFTGNAGAGAVDYIEQRIESVRRLGGKNVTVSFWAAASTVGLKLGINMFQIFGTGGAPSATVQVLTTGNAVTLATTWARYSSVIAVPSTAAKTLGTNGDDATWLRLYYSSGATGNAAAGNIGVQSGTISLWGVQLEIGSVATPLEKPDPQQDLAKCQRFFCVQQFQLFAAANATWIQSTNVNFQVTMRTTPTLVPAWGTQTNVSSPTLSAQGPSGVLVYCTAIAAAVTNLTGTFTASADL